MKLTLLFLISFLRLTSSGIIIIARTQGISLIFPGIAEVSVRFTGGAIVMASFVVSRFHCFLIADSWAWYSSFRRSSSRLRFSFGNKLSAFFHELMAEMNWFSYCDNTQISMDREGHYVCIITYSLRSGKSCPCLGIPRVYFGCLSKQMLSTQRHKRDSNILFWHR